MPSEKRNEAPPEKRCRHCYPKVLWLLWEIHGDLAGKYGMMMGKYGNLWDHDGTTVFIFHIDIGWDKHGMFTIQFDPGSSSQEVN